MCNDIMKAEDIPESRREAVRGRETQTSINIKHGRFFHGAGRGRGGSVLC